MIHIKYFGPLASELGINAETLPWGEGGNTDDLLALLRARDGHWAQALASDKIFKLVVQQQICHQVVDIPAGAEVGILPPVTGG